jgi:amyloid beta A4 protein
MTYSFGSVLGIAVGAVAAFVIIVVGIVVLRKRAHHAPSSHGFVEVDHVASPEERHVANMQINGYENPTYKYFEMNTSNA